MRLVARVIVVVAVAGLLAGGPSVALNVDHPVSMEDDFYVPATVTAAQLDTVTWTNEGFHPHNATSNQGFWTTPDLGNGGSATRTFANAGRFGYHCTVHGLDMSGAVRVRMKKSGSSGSGWTIRWSSLSSTPPSRGFDVQVKRPGSSSFTAFRTNTQARTAFFNPATTGTYAFRARTDNRTNDMSSGWSPVLSLSIS